MPKEIAGVKLYTLAELEKLTGVHIVTLRRYVREGKLQGKRIGPCVLVSEEALRDFLGANPDGPVIPGVATAVKRELAAQRSALGAAATGGKG